MSKTVPGFSLPIRRSLGVLLFAALATLPAGCGSLPRLQSPFASTASRTNRSAAKPDDNPFVDNRTDRDKPATDRQSIVHDEASKRKIREQIGHLPEEKQREILEILRDVPSSKVDDMLLAMRTRGLLAAENTSMADNRSGDDEDWPPTRNGDGTRYDPYARRRKSRDDLDVSPIGHSRDSDPRDPDSRRRGTVAPSDDRNSQGGGFGRTLLDNRLVRSLTGRPNPDSRDTRPLGNDTPDRTSRSNQQPGAAGNRADKPAEPLSGEWEDALKRLIAITDARASKLGTPTEKSELEYIRNHVYLRMLYLMAGKQEHAVAHIPRISPADQEFWQHTLWGMTDYFREDVLSSRGNRATQTVSHFRTAVQKLREQADLEVRNLVFCRKIASFGNYDTVPMKDLRYEFRAGESVLIYAEIDNFKSELTEDDQYRTRLKSTIEIYRDVPAGAGQPISFDFAPTKDVCRSQRRDYFHSYIIKLPDNLALGDYKLKLTVQDEVAGKMATETVRFRIN